MLPAGKHLLLCGASVVSLAACGEEVVVSLLEPEAVVVDDASSESDDEANPEGSTPEEPTPEGTTSAEAEPEDATPDAADPTTALSDAAAPLGADPGAASADAAAPSVAPSDGADAAAASADAAVTPEPSLIHHYDFAGTGDVVVDRVGDLDGRVLGGALLDGSGALALDGVDDYVDLPNELLDGLGAVTLSAWLTWRGGSCWQRIFDLGSSTDGEDVPRYAETSVFVTPASCDLSHRGPVREFVVSAMFHVLGTAYTVQHTGSLPTDSPAHVALVVAPVAGLVLYVDGARVAEAAALFTLSDIIGQNVWLGRSQWEQDPMLYAELDDFRVYSGVLDDGAVQQLFEAGP